MADDAMAVMEDENMADANVDTNTNDAAAMES